MTRLFTREQARAFLKHYNLKDAKGIENALAQEFGELLKEALETETLASVQTLYNEDNVAPQTDVDGQPKMTDQEQPEPGPSR